MTKNKNKVVDVQGLTTTTRVITFKEIKDAWKELTERVYEESVYNIESKLGDGIANFDPDTVRQYLDEAEAAQDLHYLIDECEDMEEYEDINFKKYLTGMRIKDKETLTDYAGNTLDLDEEIVNEMCKVFD